MAEGKKYWKKKETNKQTNRKKDIFRASKKNIYIIIIIVIVKRYICKVYILYRSSGMELPNCCKLYVHREQSVACSIAESVETSGYDLETFNLKKEIGVCVCVCVCVGGCLSHLVACCMRGCGFVYATVLTENALECSRKFRRKNKPKILCNVLPKKKGHTMMAFIQSMSSVWSPLNKFSPVEFIKDFGHGPCSQTTYLGSEITKTQLPKMLGKLLKVKF